VVGVQEVPERSTARYNAPGFDRIAARKKRLGVRFDRLGRKSRAQAGIHRSSGAVRPLSSVNVELLAERRSRDPVDLLSREFDEVCTTAIDAYQIAAALEAQGLNDRIARERYSKRDIFSLAAELHHRVPLRARAGEASPVAEGTPAPPVSALIMRGPIYLVPALFFIGAGDWVRRDGVAWIALTALLLAWVWNQGLGVLTHRLIGRMDPNGARRMARWSLATGTLIVTLVAWPIAHMVFRSDWLGLFAGAQTAYLIASAALLTFNHDRLLVMVLAPGAAMALASFLTDAVSAELVLVAALMTVAAVVAAMVWATRASTQEPFPIPSRYEVRVAAIHAILGGTWAMLIALSAIATSGPARLTALSIAAAPMVLTMGVAEWQLVALRRRAHRLLAGTGDPAEFARLARRAFLQGLSVFAVSILAITVLEVPFAKRLDLLAGNQILLSVAFVFLGCATFAGLLLVSVDRAGIAVGASGIALAATAGLVMFASTGVTDPAIAYGFGCLALCLSLTVAALRTTSQAVVHR
jgi:hypothetical protein